MMFKHSMVLGLSSLLIGTSYVFPILEVQGAELSLGFNTYSAPDFLSKSKTAKRTVPTAPNRLPQKQIKTNVTTLPSVTNVKAATPTGAVRSNPFARSGQIIKNQKPISVARVTPVPLTGNVIQTGSTGKTHRTTFVKRSQSNVTAYAHTNAYTQHRIQRSRLHNRNLKNRLYGSGQLTSTPVPKIAAQAPGLKMASAPQAALALTPTTHGTHHANTILTASTATPNHAELAMDPIVMAAVASPDKKAAPASPIIQLGKLNVPDEKGHKQTPGIEPIRKTTKSQAPAKRVSRAKTVKRTPTPIPFALQTNIKNEAMVLQSGITASLSEVDLTIGRAKIIDLQAPATRVAISDPAVASAVIVSPTQIQLVGQQVGVANLLIWNDETSGHHTIVDIAVHRDVSVLAKQLKYVDPGIHVEPLASNLSVILSGEAQSREAAQLAVELAKSFFAGGQKSSSASALPSGGGGSGAATGGAGNGSGTPTASAMSGSTTQGAFSSFAPGTSMPYPSARVINLIRVKGHPTTKLDLAKMKLKELDPNINIDIVPGGDGSEKVILTGRVATAGTISKAINTASVFYGQPGMKVVTGPGGKMIRPTGSADFQPANAFNDNLDINILQGSIVTDASGNVISMMEVAVKPQVRCSVRFLNVQASDMKQLGSSLTGQSRDLSFGHFNGAQVPLSGKTVALTGGGTTMNTNATSNYRGVMDPTTTTTSVANTLLTALGSGATQVLTINQNFQAIISALEEKRKLRSLAEPTLTMLSGEKSSFLAGGEVPIPVLGTNGQITVEYHEFGIRLNLIATVTDDGKINMQIAPEVSTVDPTNSITTNLVTVPGFATRRMQTTLEMNNGESFILAGLFSQEEADAFSRFPGIGNIPIIGNLFSGKNSDRRKNEMIVIIRPEIVTAAGGGIAPVSMENGPVQKAQKNNKEILGFADTK